MPIATGSGCAVVQSTYFVRVTSSSAAIRSCFLTLPLERRISPSIPFCADCSWIACSRSIGETCSRSLRRSPSLLRATFSPRMVAVRDAVRAHLFATEYSETISVERYLGYVRDVTTGREANEGGMCRADFVAPCTHNRWRSLAGFSRHDVVVVNEVLCRADVRPADHGNEPGYLAARDKAKRAAVGASEHGPVGIVVLAHLPGVL